MIIELNKIWGVKKKNSGYQKSKSPFLIIENTKFENERRNNNFEHNNNNIKENHESYF